MKFTLHHVRNGCRVGLLSDLTAEPLSTPTWLMYSRAGSAPYLTHDVLKLISDVPPIVQIPNGHVFEHADAIKTHGKGASAFAALPDKLVFSSMQDPGEETPSGFNVNKGAAVWGRPGKTELTIELHTKLMEAVKPSVYQPVVDADTKKDASNKRLKKSVARTLKFLDECLAEKDKSEILRNVPMLASVVGGYNSFERKNSAKETVLRPVAGFVVEGFHHNGPKVEDFKISDVADLIKISTDELPIDKPRMFPGALSPDNVIDAIKLGIDIFDLSYPYIIGERGSALSFNYTDDRQMNLKHAEGRPFEISLKDTIYARDFGPLLEGCPCYACKHHSRAYVHHLLNVSEILANVLLTIHNFQHYIGFTVQVRKSLNEDKFQELEKLIKSHAAS